MYDDVPYTISMLRKEPLNKKTIWMAWVVLETLGLIAYMPLVMLSIMYQQRFVPADVKATFPLSDQTMQLFCSLITVGNVMFLLSF